MSPDRSYQRAALSAPRPLSPLGQYRIRRPRRAIDAPLTGGVWVVYAARRRTTSAHNEDMRMMIMMIVMKTSRGACEERRTNLSQRQSQPPHERSGAPRMPMRS
jgi:hypothetical protein